MLKHFVDDVKSNFGELLNYTTGNNCHYKHNNRVSLQCLSVHMHMCVYMMHVAVPFVGG